MEAKPTLNDLMEQFLTVTPTTRNYSKETVKTYRTWLTMFVQWCGEGAGLERFTSLDLLTWQTERMKERAEVKGTYSAASIRSMKGTFNSFSVWLRERELISEDLPCPSAKMPYPKLKQQKCNPIPDEHAFAMLAACDQYADTKEGDLARAVLATFIYTGIRLNELITLRLGDVDMETGVLHVQYGKGGKSRDIPTSPEWRENLRPYLENRPDSESDRLFLSAAGVPIYNKTVYRTIKEASALAGLEAFHYTAHGFRHGFASSIVDNGGSIGAVSKLLGHSEITTTAKIYLHPSEKSIKEAAALRRRTTEPAIVTDQEEKTVGPTESTEKPIGVWRGLALWWKRIRGRETPQRAA